MFFFEGPASRRRGLTSRNFSVWQVGKKELLLPSEFGNAQTPTMLVGSKYVSSTGSEPPPISTVGSPTGCQALSWQGAEVNGVGVPPWIVCRLQGEVRETRQEDSWVIPTKG